MLRRLYTSADEAALAAEVPALMREAEAMRRSCVAPVDDQRRAVSALIFDYVRARGRKVYGGHALNDALIDASPADAFYPPGAVADVEFYSPDPVVDVVDLCNRLLAAGHRYVQGKEAMHHGTFTISVEFTRVCDVSYFPRPAFDRIPVHARVASDVASDPPLLFVQPSFAMIDMLRILCDPFTSHWKLDRHMPRMLALQRCFPFDLGEGTHGSGTHGGSGSGGGGSGSGSGKRDAKTSPNEQHAVCLAAAVGWASTATTVASVADHARAFFMLAATTAQAAEGTQAAERPPPPLVGQLTLVSTDYESDLAKLADSLVCALTAAELDGDQRGSAGVRVQEHYPLADLIGRRAILRADGAVVATLIDAKGKSVPVCARTHDGLMVAAMPYAIAMSLSLRFAAIVDNRGAAAAVHGAIVADMLDARARALAATGRTVVDINTPFRDVRFHFVGTPRSDMSMHMAAADERRVRAGPHAQVWFTYDPGRTPPSSGQAQGSPKGWPKGTGRNGNRRRGGRGAQGAGAQGAGAPEGAGCSVARRYLLLRCDGSLITSPLESTLDQREADSVLADKLTAAMSSASVE